MSGSIVEEAVASDLDRDEQEADERSKRWRTSMMRWSVVHYQRVPDSVKPAATPASCVLPVRSCALVVPAQQRSARDFRNLSGVNDHHSNTKQHRYTPSAMIKVRFECNDAPLVMKLTRLANVPFPLSFLVLA